MLGALLGSVLLLIAVGAWTCLELRRLRRDAAIQQLLALLGPARAAALHDARALLAWKPLADSARALFPDASATLDRTTGGTFPFTKDDVERAHARWTTEWLAWEQAHDEEYRLRAAAAELELANASPSAAPLARGRLDRVQHEKIERYQQRYEDYIRTAKALQALIK